MEILLFLAGWDFVVKFILLERIRKLQILLSKLKLTDTKPSFQDENYSESDKYDRVVMMRMMMIVITLKYL